MKLKNKLKSKAKNKVKKILENLINLEKKDLDQKSKTKKE